MHPTLLVLAAGMGSRYGGLKQMDPVGPSGETILDYAVFDALRAGFRRVVFIIRRDFADDFKNRVGAKYAGRIAVDYVFQSLEALPAGFSPPPGREKPWGTGHAVWCARDALAGPFAVINADDFYGADSFARLGRFLSKAPTGCGHDPVAGHPAPTSRSAQFAMVGFKLSRTLSENGAVSRGVCRVDDAGHLQQITEQTGIHASDVGPGQTYSGDEVVSMNCWGFDPTLFSGLDRQLQEFLRTRGTEPKSEFYLPAAVSTMIEQGEAEVSLLPTNSAWFGITYQEDKPRVVDAIARLVQAGEYPAKLF